MSKLTSARLMLRRWVDWSRVRWWMVPWYQPTAWLLVGSFVLFGVSGFDWWYAAGFLAASAMMLLDPVERDWRLVPVRGRRERDRRVAADRRRLARDLANDAEEMQTAARQWHERSLAKRERHELDRLRELEANDWKQPVPLPPPRCSAETPEMGRCLLMEGHIGEHVTAKGRWHASQA